MSSTHGALVVFGSGPGVGRSVAALFAERGFSKVVLISRSASRLAEDVEVVQATSAGADVSTIPVDMGNVDDVQKALEELDKRIKGTSLECVLYNAARTGKSEFFEFSPASLENDLKISVVSLYAVAQWAMPQLLNTASANQSSTPTLLVTSGMLAKDPFPGMFSLASSKAGQYSLVTSLHKAFEAKGVHCALIIIGGTVSDESKVTNARNIAEQAWKTFRSQKAKGDLEVLLADPAYEEHIKNRER